MVRPGCAAGIAGVALICVAALLAARAISDDGDASGNRGIVRGQVIGDRGAPVRDALVRVRTAHTNTVVRSDALGEFSCSVALPKSRRFGMGHVAVEHPEDPRAVLGVGLLGSGASERVRVRLFPPQSVRLVAVLNGVPAAGVCADVFAGIGRSGVPLRTARTDADGVLSLRLVPGRYAIAFSGAGVGRQAERVDVGPVSKSGEARRVELHAPTDLVVRVVSDATGAPLAGATVDLSWYFGSWPFRPVAWVTDSQGHVRIPRVALARVPKLHAMARDHQRASLDPRELMEQAERRDGAASITIRLAPLPRAQTWRWRVDPEGVALRDGETARCIYEEAGHSYEVRGRVEAGHLIVPGLRGTYGLLRVVVSDRCAARLRWDDDKATLQDRSPDALGSSWTSNEFARFVLLRERQLRLLHANGSPTTQQCLTLIPSGVVVHPDGRILHSEHIALDTDAAGRCHWRGAPLADESVLLPAGVVAGGVWRASLPKDVRQHTVRTPHPANLRLELRHDGSPGAPPDMKITIGGIDHDWTALPEAGAYGLRAVLTQDGKLPDVHVRARGVVPYVAQVVDSTHDPMLLRVDLSTSLRLAIFNSQRELPDYQLQRKVEGAWRHVADSVWSKMTIAAAYDARRHFEGMEPAYVFERVLPGTYRLVMGATGLATAPITIDGSRSHWRLDTPDGATRELAVRLLAPPGMPVAGAWVQAELGMPYLTPANELDWYRGYLGSDGTLRIRVPVASSGRVTVAHPAYFPVRAFVSIAETGPIELVAKPRPHVVIPLRTAKGALRGVGFEGPLVKPGAFVRYAGGVHVPPRAADRDRREMHDLRKAASASHATGVRRQAVEHPEQWSTVWYHLDGRGGLHVPLPDLGPATLALRFPGYVPVVLRGVRTNLDKPLERAPLTLSSGGRLRVRLSPRLRKHLRAWTTWSASVVVPSTPTSPRCTWSRRSTERQKGGDLPFVGLPPGTRKAYGRIENRGTGEDLHFARTLPITLGRETLWVVSPEDMIEAPAWAR